MLAPRHVDLDARVASSVAVERGDFGGFAAVVGSGPALVVAQDDVSSGDVAGMEPKVLGARDSEGQVVVLLGSAPDEYRETARGEVVTGARRSVAGKGPPIGERGVEIRQIAGARGTSFPLPRHDKGPAGPGEARLYLIAATFDTPRFLEKAIRVDRGGQPRVERDANDLTRLVGVGDLGLGPGIFMGDAQPWRRCEKSFGGVAQCQRRGESGEVSLQMAFETHEATGFLPRAAEDARALAFEAGAANLCFEEACRRFAPCRAMDDVTTRGVFLRSKSHGARRHEVGVVTALKRRRNAKRRASLLVREPTRLTLRIGLGKRPRLAPLSECRNGNAIQGQRGRRRSREAERQDDATRFQQQRPLPDNPANGRDAASLELLSENEKRVAGPPGCLGLTGQAAEIVSFYEVDPSGWSPGIEPERWGAFGRNLEGHGVSSRGAGATQRPAQEDRRDLA